MHRAACQATSSPARGLTLCQDPAADESVRWCWAWAGWEQKAAGWARLHIHSPSFCGDDPVPWVLPPPCKYLSTGSPRSSLPSLPPLLGMPHLFSAPEVVLAGILAESHADIFSSQPPFESCSLSHPGEGKQPRRGFMTSEHRNPPFFFSTFSSSSAPLTCFKWVRTGRGGWGRKPLAPHLGPGGCCDHQGMSCSPSQ